MSQLPQQVLNGLFAGSIYALFALGYTLVFGVLDILNLAHAAIFMMGAMVSWWLVSAQGWSLVAAFPVAVLVAGGLGIVLDRVAFLRLRRRGAGHLSPLISSIGMSLVFVGLARLLFGSDRQQFPAETCPQVYFEVGAVAAGFLVGLVEVLSVAFGRSEMKDAFVFAALFLVLILRPQGIFGLRQGNL